ncbi:MAG: mechanosensitive ion channel family protein, partial [Salinibacterium sp.]|nr:mechanosensitive ion channel family protein [Salinibacterium sp.]
VFKSSILNYTRNPRRRFDFAVGVGVDEDLEAAQRIGLEELNSVPGVLSDPPPSCRIEELGDSNVLLRFFGWVDQHEADFFKVKSQSIRLVKIVLDDHGVDMPAPIYKVEIQRQAVHDKTEPAPPPRRDERPAIDVSVDRHLEDQVEEDIRASAEEDLLDRSVKPNDTRAA